MIDKNKILERKELMYSFVLESIVLNNTSEIMNSIKSFINLKTTKVFSAGNENM